MSKVAVKIQIHWSLVKETELKTERELTEGFQHHVCEYLEVHLKTDVEHEALVTCDSSYNIKNIKNINFNLCCLKSSVFRIRTVEHYFLYKVTFTNYVTK